MSKPSFLVGVAAAICGVTLLFGTQVASGGTFNCSGVYGAVTISGNVSAGPGCDLEGTHVTGNVAVSSNGSLIANGATIDGNVEIQNDSSSNSICGTRIGGNLSIHNNSGTTSVGVGCADNTVGGNVDVHNNSGQVTVSHTHVGGNLDCHNDSPPASTGTGGNTVAGSTKGECTSSTTVSCPATGCTATISDGNTDVIVVVPGGGKSGKLVVTLSPPPPDDGCNPVGEGGPPPSSGDVVTVDPPAGYGPGNPITVDITYNFSEDLFEICKSASGKVPFTAIPMCTLGESGTPTNVPCWRFAGEGSEALVYITSTDPAINGHA